MIIDCIDHRLSKVNQNKVREILHETSRVEPEMVGHWSR